MSRWFTYLLISLFLFSCTKKETLRVSVKNIVTGEPVANMNINVYEVFNVSDGVSGTKTELFQSGETNSEGVLFLTEKFNKNRRYTVKVGKFSEEVCYINKSSYTWSVGEATDLAFEYAPCGYLRFRYVNTSCFDENDHIEVYRYTNLPDYVGFMINAEYEGCTDYEMSNFVEVPMGWWFFEWSVTKNGLTENFSDSVFIEAGDYEYYELQY